MQYRHENKYFINRGDMLVLSAGLSCAAYPDPHAKDSVYSIRSLYFDSSGDKALKANLAGIENREKFRLRYYDGDTDTLRLEKKVKRQGAGFKLQCPVLKDNADRLLDGDYSWMPGSQEPVVRELYSEMILNGMRPVSIVDYDRTAFIYDAGGVRITFDHNIRFLHDPLDFMDPEAFGIAAEGDPVILEVKWDNYLPGIIDDIISTVNRKQTAYSKYANSRLQA